MGTLRNALLAGAGMYAMECMPALPVPLAPPPPPPLVELTVRAMCTMAAPASRSAAPIRTRWLEPVRMRTLPSGVRRTCAGGRAGRAGSELGR